MIYQSLIQLFGLMAIGYIANKCNILDSIANKKISKLLVNIAIPTTILSSAIAKEQSDFESISIVFIIAVVYFILASIISHLCGNIFSLETEHQLLLTYTNLGFMGIPIISSIYGGKYLFYVTIFMIVFNISLFSHGSFLLRDKNIDRISIVKILKELLNTGIITSFLALYIFMLKIPVQADISNIISNVASITTPLAMMVIGATLGEVSLKDTITDRKLYFYAFLKLIIYPVIAMLLLDIFITDKSIIGMVIILTALPGAGNISMLCSEYNKDVNLVSKGIFVSTIFSIVIIPFWIYIITNLNYSR